MSLAVSKVYGLCPGGDLREVLARRRTTAEFSAADFQGHCDQACLRDLNTLLPGKSLRRAPRLARLALRAALEVRPETLANQALVLNTFYSSVGSTFEFLDSLLNDGPSLASPTAFSHSVTNMTAAYLGQNLNLTGPSLTLTQSAFAPSLEAADLLLRTGQAEMVLLGFVAEHSDTMQNIEELAGQPLSGFTDGAVFFQLRSPGSADNELRIDLFHQPESDMKNDDISNDASLSCLPLAPRLALAFLEMIAEESPAARYFIRDDGLGIISLSGNGERT